jgi:heme/copper-type cytochrome/quinol oxidase subunit 2
VVILGDHGMTTLLSLIIYTSITALTILAIMLIYNVVELFKWKWKIKYNYSNTEYEHKQVRHHKKKIILLTPAMIIFCAIILSYKAPVSFEKILGSKEYANSIKTLDITSSGSIHDSATGQAYIVNTENEEEFFDRLIGLLEVTKQ